MSLHWTLIAGFLYAEIVVVLLLLIPLVSSRAWNKLFKSNFLKGLKHQLIYYFYVLVAILVLFFLDAIREMRKYSEEQGSTDHAPTGHLDIQIQMHMRLFRAQRNFYISGFALLLCLIIKRLVSLISSNSTLEAEREAAMKQAQSASRAAESMLSDKGDKSDQSSDKEKELEQKLKKSQEELSKAKKDLDSMKTQAENVSAEYDRLMEEKDKLERQLRVTVGQGGDKKDD